MTFLSLVAYQLGRGGAGPLGPPDYAYVMNRLNDLCLKDMAPENAQWFRSHDWQTTASRPVSDVNLNPFHQLNENRENVNVKTSNPVKSTW